MANVPLTDGVVADASRGDRDAMRQVYLCLAGPVLGYLQAKGVRDAEEVTSEVFLAVIPRLPQVTGGANGLRRLVFTIAHARMVDHYRERGRTGEVSEYQPHQDKRVEPPAEDVALSRISTPAVIEALALLPDDQRDVIALRFVADLSLEQVAAIIGRSEGAVKQLQRRGLNTVRDALRSGRVTL
ncbi:RNA polymerase sigma factor [Jatrophihabitans sp.]|uniref:RNA polymerase sigma factor n=1 Tax=Jatrophihabitans sp. TaxID=1932789 RepID=UPI0030C6E04D|nr:rpoE [Jatrophihabitans sp.]